MRWSSNYSGCVTVGADRGGLYLSLWPLFNVGHPRLFIPWAETRIEMKRRRWLGDYMEVQFLHVPGVLLRFGARLAARIAAAAAPTSAA